MKTFLYIFISTLIFWFMSFGGFFYLFLPERNLFTSQGYSFVGALFLSCLILALILSNADPAQKPNLNMKEVSLYGGVLGFSFLNLIYFLYSLFFVSHLNFQIFSSGEKKLTVLNVLKLFLTSILGVYILAMVYLVFAFLLAGALLGPVYIFYLKVLKLI